MVVMYLRMLCLKPTGGMKQVCMSVRCAVLAAPSARSLPGMPTWPSSQQRSMSKPDAVSDISLYIEREGICAIMGWSVLRWSSACRHEMESVKITNPARLPQGRKYL